MIFKSLITPVSAALALATCINLMAIAAARADIRITDDPGGSIRQYGERVRSLRASGEKVIVDGRCNSACTLYLTLPAGQLCVTPRAVFGFHSVVNELGLPDPKTNDEIMNAYPPKVQIEIGKRGGLWIVPFFIKGTALAPRCK